MRRLLWMLLAALACVSGEYLMGGHLDNNAGSKSPRNTHLDDQDLVAEESTVAAVAVADASAKSSALSDGEGDAPRYHIPYSFAFNGGKPFSLEKDPITGKIDFEKTPLVKPLNHTDGHREGQDDSEDGDGGREDAGQERTKSKDHDDVRRNEITQSHYFLPTHYTSDKYQYPLISSSYANTKVQSGANSYNHRLDAENDVLYARPTRNPYLSMMKTSTHKTTTAGDLNARWTTSPPTITTSAPSTTANTRATKTPAITTWKPTSTPIAFHAIDRTVAEMENEKNLLPIEKLHASGQAASQRNQSHVPTRPPSDGTTTQKAQPSLDNFVVSHARPETKPPAQTDEYSYDIYDLSSSEEEDKGDGDGDSSDDSKVIDYFLPFQELLKENVTSTSSTTSSRPTASTTTTTTTTTTTVASSTGSTASTTTTAAPQLPSRSSTPPAPHENVGKPLQFSTIPQYPAASLHNDRRPSLPERHDGIINHVYRPGPMIKPEADRIGVGIPIESTSNIVIPPDQNTVSFVLGNRQNVEGSYHSVGTAVGENLFGTSADISFWPLRNDQHGSVSEVKYEHSPVTKPSVTQKWPSPTSGALKGSSELDPTRSPNPAVPPADTAQYSPQGNKDSDYVIFPDDETKNKDALTEEHVVIINEADGSIRELPPKTTATANGTKLAFPTVGEDLPQLAQDLMPPAESTRPPQYYYHYQYDTSRPDHPRPRLPLPSRVKPHPGLPVSPLDPALRKRPYSPDTKLPNILPQFRPNAKASHGHRGPDAIGTMSAGPPTRIRQPVQSHPPLPGHPASRRPFPPAPSYLQRLNPPPPPIHAVRLPFGAPTSKVDGVVPSHETEPAIRRFVSPARPPHGAPPVISHGNPEENMLSNRLFSHGPEERNGGVEGENRKEDRVKSELEQLENSERYPEEPPMTPPRPPLFPKLRTADSPRVTTLQMLQHHGELNDESEEAAQAAETVLTHEMERRKSDDHDSPETAEQPVYVVYPVNTAVNIDPDDSSEKDGSVVVGTRGPQRPLPPDTLLQDEREETHAIYNGKPVAADFPYLLERPDPSSVFPAAGVKETPVLVPSEQRQQVSAAAAAAAAASEREKIEQDVNEQVNVIPYLQDQFLPYRKKNDAAISVTLHRNAPTATSTPTAPTSTSTPIAYVYTPTQAAHRPDYDDLENDANAAVDAKQTVLLPSQQPSSSSSSAPAPQNFMAPFVASISAEAPSKNGWSVVVVDPPAGIERKSNGDGDGDPDADTQTEKNEFDADNFKPQLFGGFKPIYQFPTEDTEQRDVAEQTDTELNMPRHAKKLPSAPAKR
ncbi:mucin-6-like [Linepithema humile]|uniref:mucin-6-like n=1 Tax=Linepithema humile TaxID=83485 RepID=UPI00351E053E